MDGKDGIKDKVYTHYTLHRNGNLKRRDFVAFMMGIIWHFEYTTVLFCLFLKKSCRREIKTSIFWHIYIIIQFILGISGRDQCYEREIEYYKV